LLLSEGATESAALLALLRELLAEDSPCALALATIRSDTYERLETANALEGIRRRACRPMPRGAYQTIIEGPAKRLKDTDRPSSSNRLRHRGRWRLDFW
jgi:hypothetical protein